MKCHCDSGLMYAACCAPFHGGVAAPTPEALMRSRYSAYVLSLNDYLRLTWHNSTRPDDVSVEAGLKWLGLSVKNVWSASENEAFVEFVARFKAGGARAERIHETSRFVRERFEDKLRWFYVDGTFL